MFFFVTFAPFNLNKVPNICIMICVISMLKYG